ncbi:MAG TPA: NlpC/P60 family protein [Gaiella sp.]|jgi:cell wall-associated NlpC family hydrolase|nr:NlpC/P60 family protein [Gaiella sp.]
MTHSRARQAPWLVVALAALATALLVGVSAATADPSISSKREQAQAILGQVREMDSQLSHAIESYNLANIQLDEIDADLQVNGRHLTIAKASLGVAQQHIAKRLRALYINGDSGGAVEVILGARSLDDLLDRLDMVQRVGGQDAQVLKDVRHFRNEVQTRRAKLKSDRARQAQIVAERAARKRSIEGQLAERQRLLASVKDEIARMEAAERRRQAQLEAQARARLEAAAAARTAASQQTLDFSSGNAVAEDPLASYGSTPAPPAKYGGVVGIAMQYLGVPYVWGGGSPSGFDCSGLVMYAYSQIGVSLPHNAAMMYGSVGVSVSRGELAPGDLVFFDGLGHMGMYIGGDQFIHAPHTGDVVKISSLNDSWYASTYVGAKRVV